MRLRPLLRADAGALAAALADDPEIRATMTDLPECLDAEGVAGWIAGARERGVVALAVLEARDLIGCVGMGGRPDLAQFGYWLAPRWRGRGLGREMVARAVGLADRRGIARLYALVRPDNRPSVAVLVANGFVAAGAMGDLDRYERGRAPIGRSRPRRRD